LPCRAPCMLRCAPWSAVGTERNGDPFPCRGSQVTTRGGSFRGFALSCSCVPLAHHGKVWGPPRIEKTLRVKKDYTPKSPNFTSILPTCHWSPLLPGPAPNRCIRGPMRLLCCQNTALYSILTERRRPPSVGLRRRSTNFFHTSPAEVIPWQRLVLFESRLRRVIFPFSLLREEFVSLLRPPIGRVLQQCS